MINKVTLLVCAIMVSSCALQAAERTWQEKAVKVVALSDLPPGSGVLSTYVEISIVKEDRSKNLIFLQYFGDEQILPFVGHVCDFNGRMLKLNGQSTAKAYHDNMKRRYVDTFECYSDSNNRN